MDGIVLLADNDASRRTKLQDCFRTNGFFAVAVANGRACLEELVAIEPDVLVIALGIPWGGGDGVIARLADLPLRCRPLVFVFGDAPVEALSARTGIATDRCFSTPVYRDSLMERIEMELTVAIGRGPARRNGYRHLELLRCGPVSLVRPRTCRLFGRQMEDEVVSEWNSVADCEDCRTLLVDCSSAKILDSAVLGKLIGVQRRLKSKGGKVVFCNVREEMREILRWTKLDRVFEIRKAVEQDALSPV